jgi:hypothetical protein
MEGVGYYVALFSNLQSLCQWGAYIKLQASQGDPLSPMLFIIAIDPLVRLFDLASSRGLLAPIGRRAARLRVSLYADDAAIFVHPDKADLRVVGELLSLFGRVTGLVNNVMKSEVYPIACHGRDLGVILADFPCQRKEFPCRYLGLPLHVRRLRRSDTQFILDMMGSRLAGWKGKLFNRMGRLTLINSVLMPCLVYFLSSFSPSKWLVGKANKLMRAFLWKGADVCNGGHCLVNWQQVCRPKSLGGLGIKHIEKFSSALRLRWLWFRWMDKAKPWVGTATPNDEKDKALFDASVIITVNDGGTAKFWTTRWLQGMAPADLAPHLFALVRWKNRSVAFEMQDNRWVRPLRAISTAEQVSEYVHLWTLIREVTLVAGVGDSVSWRWTSNGQYSAKSAYDIQFAGSFSTINDQAIWKAKAEHKCKFFTWLLVRKRVYTSDRLQARGWPCSAVCCLCGNGLETADHLALACSFSKQVWRAVAVATAQPAIALAIDSLAAGDVSFPAWWDAIRAAAPAPSRAGIDGIITYTVWNLWGERNRRIFQNCYNTVAGVCGLVKDAAVARAMAFRRVVYDDLG